MVTRSKGLTRASFFLFIMKYGCVMSQPGTGTICYRAAGKKLYFCGWDNLLTCFAPSVAPGRRSCSCSVCPVCSLRVLLQMCSVLEHSRAHGRDLKGVPSGAQSSGVEIQVFGGVMSEYGRELISSLESSALDPFMHEVGFHI